MKTFLKSKQILILGLVVIAVLVAVFMSRTRPRSSVVVLPDKASVVADGFDAAALDTGAIFKDTSAAQQTCAVTPFVHNARSGTTADYTIMLTGYGEHPFGVRIGDLPQGVTLRFGSVAQRKQQTEIPVAAVVANDPQRGSFTMSIAFAVRSNNEIASTTCRFSLVIE